MPASKKLMKPTENRNTSLSVTRIQSPLFPTKRSITDCRF